MSSDQQQNAQRKFSGKPADPSRHPGTRRGFPLQFGLGRLMLALSVASAMLAPLAYLMRALQGQRRSQLTFVLLCLAAPSLLLVATSLLYGLLNWGRRRPHG